MGRNIKNHTNGRKIKRNNPPFIRMINKYINLKKLKQVIFILRLPNLYVKYIIRYKIYVFDSAYLQRCFAYIIGIYGGKGWVVNAHSQIEHYNFLSVPVI